MAIDEVKKVGKQVIGEDVFYVISYIEDGESKTKKVPISEINTDKISKFQAATDAAKELVQ